MRIRQTAKITGISISNSGINSVDSSPICHFNQSPWDLLSASQIDGDNCNIRNGSLEDSIGNIKRDVIVPGNLGKNIFLSNGEGSNVEQKKNQCAKKNGKSWRCKNEVVLGESLCRHHLDKSVAVVTKEPPKKRSVSASDSGYLFYSGFGPGTGKQRGQENLPDATRIEVDIENYTDLADISDSSDDDKRKGTAKFAKKKARKTRSLRSL